MLRRALLCDGGKLNPLSFQFPRRFIRSLPRSIPHAAVLFHAQGGAEKAPIMSHQGSMGNSAAPQHQLVSQEGSFKPRTQPPAAKRQPKDVLSHSRGQDPTFRTDHRPRGAAEAGPGGGEGLLPSARTCGEQTAPRGGGQELLQRGPAGRQRRPHPGPAELSLSLTC